MATNGLSDDILLAARSLLEGDFGSPIPILQGRNSAIRTNPPVADNNITSRGSSWLWAVMSLHAFLFLFVLGLTMVTKHRQRVFHYIALALLLIPTITYFTMASNLGGTPVRTQFRQNGIPSRTRQIFWVRYIGWTFTFSLIALALLLMTAVGWSTIIWTIALTILYAVMLLVGALTPTSYKWGYFAFAILAYFLLVYQLLFVARPWARRFNTSKWYLPLTAYILFFWALYPVSWGLSEGGNVISNDGECVFYGVLDIFSKGLFALLLVFLAKKLDFHHLGLWMHDHGRIPPGYGEGTGIMHEKAARTAGGATARDSGLGYNEGQNGTRSGRVVEQPMTTTSQVV